MRTKNRGAEKCGSTCVASGWPGKAIRASTIEFFPELLIMPIEGGFPSLAKAL
jgi:hypothetical protein